MKKGKIILHNDQFVIEYEPSPHAGISKLGTGPGVNRKFKQIIPIHPTNIDLAQTNIGKEVTFTLSTLTGVEAIKTHAKISMMDNKIYYKGKGEHSIRELEKIIEQQNEELHLLKSKPSNIDLAQLLLNFVEFPHPHDEPRGSVIYRFLQSQSLAKPTLKLELNQKVTRNDVKSNEYWVTEISPDGMDILVRTTEDINDKNYDDYWLKIFQLKPVINE